MNEVLAFSQILDKLYRRASEKQKAYGNTSHPLSLDTASSGIVVFSYLTDHVGSKFVSITDSEMAMTDSEFTELLKKNKSIYDEIKSFVD